MLPTATSHQSIRNANGLEICYYDRGAGDPVVLVHGMFGDFLDWEPALEPLAQHRRVIAVDLPGFGASSKPRVEYSADFFISTLHELFAQLALGPFAMMGNSFGGQIAILYALSQPKSVSKLVLVNSGGFRHYPEQEREPIEARFNESILAALTPEINSLLFAGVFTKASEARERYLQKQNNKLKRPDYPAYSYALARSIRLSMQSYLLDRLAELECPTLLVWGEQDQVLPLAQAQQALTRLRKGELQVIAGCGHAPQLECPEQFLQVAGRFLSESGR